MVSAAALGLPWDIDMADSSSRNAYTCWKTETAEDGTEKCINSMRTLPEGTVSQPNLLTPNAYTVDYPKFDPRWAELHNPVATGPATLASGQKMYRVYCAPCHGNVEGNAVPKLGPVSDAGMVGVVPLTGAAGVLKGRTDGHLYRVVRKGNAIMPAYGWAMTDREVWSLIHYMRTLDGAQYVPPAPIEPDEEGGQ
jgi:mono/diheme cytochrome c family protein